MKSLFPSTLVLLMLATPVSWGLDNASTRAASVPPTELLAKPLSNRLGLTLNEYAFFWKAPNEAAGYEILVASDETKLALDVGDLWDSGRRYGPGGNGVRYRGTALADGARVHWKARVLRQDGPSDWSSPAIIDVDNDVVFTPEIARNRIVFLGGGLVSDMEKFGYLETAITAHWPKHDIHFRNLGWPADDVFGTARSGFGSAQNTRSWQPPEAENGFGFGELMRQVREAKPSTIIVGYGAEAAWMEPRDFERGYRQLLEFLKDTRGHLILLTPIRQKAHGAIVTTPGPRNDRLEAAAEFILQVAEEGGYPAINLFGEEEFTYKNGIHLDQDGHRKLAALVGAGLGVLPAGFEVALAPDFAFIGGLASELTAAKHGYRWNVTLDRLQVSGMSGGVVGVPQTSLKIDGVAFASAFPVERQVETLREAIVVKNQFHRYRTRPINEAYIFLFRRHEMGHLANEMHDLDDLIARQERIIANLRVPRKHVWEIERITDWKSPRDYPDHEVPNRIPAPDIEAELAAFTVADGFEINLFAKNPMIANPINLNWDNRGRAWVSTSTTYPHIKPGRIPNDRIVILEDVDRDGFADTHKVFAEGLTVPHSVMPVKGGAYVCSTTEFLFLPDEDGDDVADSVRVIFTGFGNADVHHMIHGLRWSPWGDLHFVQSIYINSFVETAHGPRRINGSGVWKFRPETERLDALAIGMVNPWGLAFDRWGQSFSTDGAGGSGPHYIFPGAAYGSATGAHRVLKGMIPGKPKNTAAEVVGGRHLPEHWRGSLLANDFRANRTVRYSLEDDGSGYRSDEVETVLHSGHRSFRPVDIKIGPDGAVYVVDWYNPIIDHGEVDFHHPLRDRSHGRIWRLSSKRRPLVERPNIVRATNEELLEMLKEPEPYTRLQANRELASRPRVGVMKALDRWIGNLDRSNPEYENHRLEGLWLSMAHRAALPELTEDILRSPSPQARSAAVRVVSNWQSDETVDKVGLLAKMIEDESPRVRLETVNALREIGTLQATDLALRAMDYPTDDNLNFALELTVREARDVWLPAVQSGREVFGGDPQKLKFALNQAGDARVAKPLLTLIEEGKIAEENLAGAVRTIAALGAAEDLESLVVAVGSHPDWLPQLAAGARDNSARPGRTRTITRFLTSEETSIRTAGAELCGLWGIVESVNALNLSRDMPPPERDAVGVALARLGAVRKLKEFAESGDDAIRQSVLSALARYHPREAVPEAKSLLPRLGPEEARPALAAFMASRVGVEYLSAALENTTIASETAIVGIRLAQRSGREMTQLVQALNDAGELKPVSQDLSPEERKAILADAAETGNDERGRAIYNRQALGCVACHTIGGVGGKLGPDLTTVGAYMTPESLLESLLNPDSSIKQGFETVLVTRKDDSVVSGLLQRKTELATLVRDPTGTVVAIPNGDIANLDASSVSLMPPGLTASLRRDELVDLMRYLISLGNERIGIGL